MTRFVLAAVLVAGCYESTEPNRGPPERFGAVTAVIDGRQWVSSYFQDSTVAFYEPATGRLQITGQKLVGEIPPTLHIFVDASGGPGTYVFGAMGKPALGQWFELGPAARPHDRGVLLGYQSVGAVGDFVVIEELDLTTRVVRGQFRFVARLIRSEKEVRVTGRFAGRVLLLNQ